MRNVIAHSPPPPASLAREGLVVSLVSVFVARLLLEGIAAEGHGPIVLGLVVFLLLELIIELILA